MASIKVPFKKDPIETLIPNQDLPVDTERLRKAIKNALIKNDNNPDKIDIQSIMREQVRIHKHIQEFKQSRRKQSTEDAGLKNAYFSSRIVKKIAEDHIHQSLKQIITAAEQGQIKLDSFQQSLQSKSQERVATEPSKFQKLLASKFNQGFQSVLARRPDKPEKSEH